MKRHPTLHGLSTEHHLGLVQARALRRASVAAPQQAEARAQEFLAFWNDALAGHFRAEEEVLLPHCSRHLPADDPRIVRTLVEHIGLRRDVLDLRGQMARGEDLRELLGRLGACLHDHIRFEERELFVAIQAALPEPALQALGEALAAAGIARGTVCAVRTAPA